MNPNTTPVYVMNTIGFLIRRPAFASRFALRAMISRSSAVIARFDSGIFVVEDDDEEEDLFPIASSAVALLELEDAARLGKFKEDAGRRKPLGRIGIEGGGRR